MIDLDDTDYSDDYSDYDCFNSHVFRCKGIHRRKTIQYKQEHAKIVKFVKKPKIINSEMKIEDTNQLTSQKSMKQYEIKSKQPVSELTIKSCNGNILFGKMKAYQQIQQLTIANSNVIVDIRNLSNMFQNLSSIVLQKSKVELINTIYSCKLVKNIIVRECSACTNIYNDLIFAFPKLQQLNVTFSSSDSARIELEGDQVDESGVLSPYCAAVMLSKCPVKTVMNIVLPIANTSQSMCQTRDQIQFLHLIKNNHQLHFRLKAKQLEQCNHNKAIQDMKNGLQQVLQQLDTQ